MGYQSDAEIARAAVIAPIGKIAEEAGLSADELESYGKFKAKVDYKVLGRLAGKPDGKLILVTAVNPTPAGEGKTTVSIGLADALRRLGARAFLALREPSLGPVFGMKGGATGGGRAQVLPMDDINLHFTGDIHAVSAANNLLAALLDNHIYHGNALGIDPRSAVWRRCIDMNDRQLRSIVSGLAGKSNGTPREDGFDITAASEVMAILCLSLDMADLKERLGRIVAAYTWDGAPVTAGDLKAHGAMAALLKDALKPNLVQTIEHTPAFVHGGPFANIAHGCNSAVATKTALKLADYVVTEAGFGADLGAEKFCDIKCRAAGIFPSACVIVASARALKHHGGMKPDAQESAAPGDSLKYLEQGLPNLFRHASNMRNVFHIPAVAAINRFAGDSAEELEFIQSRCRAEGFEAVITDVWEKGGEGGIPLAESVLKAAAQAGAGSGANADANANANAGPGPGFAYGMDLPIKEKTEAVARAIYGADGVDFTPDALKDAARLKKLGYGKLAVCVAKTQYSFTDNPKKYGAPSGFRITVRGFKLLAGAGFAVALSGDITAMPGLPKTPASESVGVGEDGEITGLF